MAKNRPARLAGGAAAPAFTPVRRRLLQGALGAGWLALAGRNAAAQSRGLRRASPDSAAAAEARGSQEAFARHALVIGNGRYPESPLRNPANDARAVADRLAHSGFEVTPLLDAGREAMLGAIEAYGGRLQQRGGVGLFYFAGHGVQLAWRNYLIPVDAVVDNEADVRARAIELNALLGLLTRAKNPMNVIILDACRDNPFGRRYPVGQKGLSQFDAPPGSLLAYATAPGNVASDGAGEHGLYTENLLREMRVPEAKIEDVFKRVRLNVRRRSNGRQIPWESTSLEDDFYFLPPRSASRRSAEEETRRFEAELALWEQIKDATEPGPFEDYLRRHPSGRFSELAQLQLDRILARQGEQRIEVAPAAGNPYSKGTAVAGTRYHVGDSYTYRSSDLYTNLDTGTVTHTIVRITDTEVVYDSGLVTDLLGNQVKTPDGRQFGPTQFLPLEFAVGRRWTTRFRVVSPKGGAGEVELDMRIATREFVTVPAGTFDAFRLEARGWSNGPWGTLQITGNVWLAPDRVRRAVAREDHRVANGIRVVASRREELIAYRQS